MEGGPTIVVVDIHIYTPSIRVHTHIHLHRLGGTGKHALEKN